MGLFCTKDLPDFQSQQNILWTKNNLQSKHKNKYATEGVYCVLIYSISPSDPMFKKLSLSVCVVVIIYKWKSILVYVSKVVVIGGGN